MTEYFRKADRLRRIRRNQEMWWQGMYIYEAIGDMAPVLRTSLDKKSHKPLKYPEEPYPIDEREVQERKEREKRDEAKKIDKVRATFEAMVARVNVKFEKKEGVNENGFRNSDRKSFDTGNVGCQNGSGRIEGLEQDAGQTEKVE